MNISESINFLSGMVTEDRFNTLTRVLKNRTAYITVVLEDIFQSHNASAVLRSCDCFGIQYINMIENKYNYTENKEVAMGSAQWLNIIKHSEKENNTLDAIKKLRQQGYRIVATTPHTNDTNIEDFDLEKGKIALFFGSELPGLSNIVMENADEFVKIPMVGFTESFNISVSAALCLYELSSRLRKSNINWQLSDAEKETILLNWLKISVKNAENIIKFHENRISK